MSPPHTTACIPSTTPKTFEQLITAANQSGRATQASWNGRLFAGAAREPAEIIWEKSGRAAGATENYLRLLVEGIGRGCFPHAIDPEHAPFFAQDCHWRCVLEYRLKLTVPLEVPKLPPAGRTGPIASWLPVGDPFR